MYAIEIRYLPATNTKDPRIKAVLGVEGRTGNPRRTLTMTDDQLEKQMWDEYGKTDMPTNKPLAVAQALLDKYHPDLEVAAIGELPNKNQVVMCKQRVRLWDENTGKMYYGEREYMKAKMQQGMFFNSKKVLTKLMLRTTEDTHEPTSDR